MLKVGAGSRPAFPAKLPSALAALLFLIGYRFAIFNVQQQLYRHATIDHHHTFLTKHDSRHGAL